MYDSVPSVVAFSVAADHCLIVLVGLSGIVVAGVLEVLVTMMVLEGLVVSMVKTDTLLHDVPVDHK